MDNPIKLILWANVNVLIQYLQFSKTMLDAFFPVPAPSRQPAPVQARIPVKRGGCVGPADLHS
jgi:hypothetical protein